MSSIRNIHDIYSNAEISREEREILRLRFEASCNEASALGHARREEREKWQSVVADKDAALADKDAEIALLRAKLEAIRSGKKD